MRGPWVWASSPQLESQDCYLFFVGILCVVFSFALILEIYVYIVGLTSYGYTILMARDVGPLFLFIGLVLMLGMFGGYEIGRFIEVNKKKQPMRLIT